MIPWVTLGVIEVGDAQCALRSRTALARQAAIELLGEIVLRRSLNAIPP